MATTCPNCKKLNNPTDLYCSYCGHRLVPDSKGICPQCGAQNPESNDFCDTCGEPLAATGSLKTGSEGSIHDITLPGKDSLDEAVPDWLTALRANLVEDEEDDSEETYQPEFEDRVPEKKPESAPFSDDEMPDWLREITVPPLPRENTEELTKERPTTGDIPDWLRDVLEEHSAVQPDDPRRPSLTDVLLTLPKTDLDILGSGALPDWLTSLSPTPDGEKPKEKIEDDASLAPPEPPRIARPKTETPQVPPPPPPARTKVDTAPAKKSTDSLPQSDWLEDPFSRDSALWAEQDVEPEAGTESATIGLPEWLQELGLEVPDLAQPEPLIVEEEPKKELPAEEPLHRQKRDKKQSKSLTDWLGVTATGYDEPEKPKTGSTSELPGTGPLGPPEIPDWLAAVSSPAKTAELPSWLTQDLEELPPPVKRDRTPVIQEEEEGDLGSLPSWLTTEDAGAFKQPEPATDHALPAVDIPAWLEEAAKAGKGYIQAADEPPYWQIPPAEPEQILTREEAELQADAQGLAHAEIPEWLNALRPRGAAHGVVKPEPAVSPEPAETSGPLQGIKGALTAADAVAVPPKRFKLPRFVITEQQQQHEQIAERIIHPDKAEKPSIVEKKVRVNRFERIFIPILILIAVLVPAVPELNITAPFLTYDQPEPAPLQDSYSLVEGLPDSALVIAAFDFSPASSGELEPLAGIMVQHLMDKNARIVAISTTPAGPQIAQAVMEDKAASSGYVYGQDYYNLGYLPGGAAGLQAFAADPWSVFPGPDLKRQQDIARNAPIVSDLDSALVNVGLIVVFTADRDDIVEWLEQVGQFSSFSPPIIAGASAGLEAWAQPYYYSEPRQLSGVVSGIPGAAGYEIKVTNDRTGEAFNRRNNQAIGLIVIIVLIVIGMLSSTLFVLIRGRHGNG